MDPDSGDEPFSIGPFRQFFLSQESATFRHALAELNLGLNLAEVAGLPIDPRQYNDVARVIVDSLLPLLERDLNEAKGISSWIGADRPLDVEITAYRGRAAEILSFAGFLMVAGAGQPERLMAGMARAAFGLDPLSTHIGDILRGRHIDLDWGGLPQTLDSLRDILARTCVVGITHAGTRLGQAASQRPRPFAQATITNIAPQAGCGGTEITITGTGFGEPQPPGVTVMFTNRTGSCTSAQVLSWSDVSISVVAPPDVGHGCVGLIEQPSGFGGLSAAAHEFAGELESCLGPMASVAANNIRASAAMLMAATCPVCDNPNARFLGGPPVVKAFAANGRATVELSPGDSVTVDWDVEGADELSIVPTQPTLPPIPGPLQTKGSVQIANVNLNDGTVGSWTLTATNACGSITALVTIVIRGRKALVLSAGGTRAAFEVGAARCLRDVAGITFDIVTGTSFGALNAAKLAEGGATAQSDLERMWLGLQVDSDLYVKKAWFRQFDPIIQQILSSSSTSLLDPLVEMAASYATNKMLGALAQAMGVPGIIYTVITSFYPVVTGVVKVANYVDAGIKAVADTSLFSPAPFDSLVTANLRPTRIANSGIQLRITALPLETGRTRVFDQRGMMVDSGFQVPVADAVRASAAIPIAFPPVSLQGPQGTENYVNGALRESTPIAAAVEAGAHRVFAVLTSPNDIARQTAFPLQGAGFNPAAAPMVIIAARCVTLFLHEALTNDLEPFGGFGVPITVIAPSFSTYDPLLVDPGLIAINMDYGYLRAYDEVVADPAARGAMRQSSDAITALRLDIWNDEHFAHGEPLPWEPIRRPSPNLGRVASPEAMQIVRDKKHQLRRLVLQRIAASTSDSAPANRATWWQRWERHRWVANNPASPWDRFVSRLGNLDAEAVPPPN